MDVATTFLRLLLMIVVFPGAGETVNVLKGQWFRPYGVLRYIYTGDGSVSKSEAWCTFLRRFGIQVLFTAVGAPHQHGSWKACTKQ